MGETVRLLTGDGQSLSIHPETGALRYEAGEGRSPAVCGGWIRAAFREAPDSETFYECDFHTLRANVAGDSLLFCGLETAADVYVPGKPEYAGRSVALRTPAGVSRPACDKNGGITIPRGSRLWSIEMDG